MTANVTKRDLQKQYMEYWNSTAGLTDTGRPVDCIIAPVAPFPVSTDCHHFFLHLHFFFSATVSLRAHDHPLLPNGHIETSAYHLSYDQAPRPSLFTYYGYTVWVNVLDYTSVVIPVTNVDKSIDTKAENFQAVNDMDQKTQDACMISAAAPSLPSEKGDSLTHCSS